MFLGTYAPKLDEKGRIILPAKFRDELAGGVVMTRGQERCIYVFSQREFETLHEKIRQAPVTSKQARDYPAPVPLRRQPGDARQAAPRHHSREPARVRGPRPRPHRHRRGQPRRDLGHRGLEHLLRRAGGRLLRTPTEEVIPGLF